MNRDKCAFCLVPDGKVVTRISGGYWRESADWLDCMGNPVDSADKEITACLGMGLSEDVVVDLFRANRLFPEKQGASDPDINLCARCVRVVQMCNGNVEHFEGYSQVLQEQELNQIMCERNGIEAEGGKQRFRRRGVVWDAFLGGDGADINLDDRLLEAGFTSYFEIASNKFLVHRNKWNNQDPSHVTIGWATAIGLMMESAIVRSGEELPGFMGVDVDDPLSPSPFKGDILVGGFKVYGIDATIDPGADPDDCLFHPPNREMLRTSVKPFIESMDDSVSQKSRLARKALSKRNESEW